MSAPILYSFRRCPYAMRARMALWVAGIRWQHREVVLRDKPQAMLEISPKGTVPVLHTDVVVDESLEIMRWALAQSDPQGWLQKAGPDLIAHCDGPFKVALDRYKYDTRYGSDRLAEREVGAAWLRELDGRLKKDRFLMGAGVGLCDVAIFPFVRQFANADRAWFDAQDWPALAAWLQGWLDSEAFRAIMVKHAQWLPDDPVVWMGESA